MSTELTMLPNGLRVVTHAMPNLATVSLGIWIDVGSRHERDDEHGLAHFLEHMAFKGTKKRSARAIAEEIESLGGDLNAATGLDTTAYYARILAGDEGVALEMLADILLNSKFAPEDLNRERVVIQQEIASTDDNPDDVVFDLMQGVAFPDQALGRPILGTKASVARFGASELRSYLRTHYLPDSMVVSASGAVRHADIVRHAEALFGGLTPGRRGDESQAHYRGGSAALGKTFEQSHVLIGLPSPSYLDPAFYAAQVFSGLFGGGMSSRLFQEIREDRGLCYSIYSTVWGVRDTGMLAVHAATGADMVEELSAVVAQELGALAKSGPTDAELLRSKAQIKAGLLMALESSAVYTEQMARQLLAHGRLVEVSELVNAVENVGPDDVKAFAGRLMGETASVAVLGSGKKSAGQAARVAAMFNPMSAQLADAQVSR
ncbi:peptidase M16 [Hyphomicrobium methylovorum]|uniref:M16 family metallopeptidase n=1 Tax=Hyphomicrobium methylovorum TaxID=84 RepID=UPI0015E7B91C|nr:pitrilysin family protein [Hyphomicrobium methylovorum]MBA2125830.1 peptidase M16 [Hyphomicrobium methylovorum]